jgi:hypothetical protein
MSVSLELFCHYLESRVPDFYDLFKKEDEYRKHVALVTKSARVFTAESAVIFGMFDYGGDSEIKKRECREFIEWLASFYGYTLDEIMDSHKDWWTANREYMNYGNSTYTPESLAMALLSIGSPCPLMCLDEYRGSDYEILSPKCLRILGTIMKDVKRQDV